MSEFRVGTAIVIILTCVGALISERRKAPPIRLTRLYWLMLGSAAITILQTVNHDPAWEWFLIAAELVVVIALVVAAVQFVRQKQAQTL